MRAAGIKIKITFGIGRDGVGFTHPDKIGTTEDGAHTLALSLHGGALLAQLRVTASQYRRPYMRREH